jgi:hypothetical protein
MCACHGLITLGARMTGDANLARGHHQERPTLKRFSVFLEDGIKLFDFRLKGCSGEPKEDDAGVAELLVEDQLAEIAVSNHQDPSLLPGDSQDIRIGKTRRIVARDGGHVMAELAKVRN